MRDIGKNIKDLRIAKGFTQDQLAEKLFVTRQTVSNYENGKSRPDIDMLAKISEVLDCDVNDIIYGTATGNQKKREYTKLAVGALLTSVTVLLFEYLSPIVYQIKSTHYLASFSFFLQFTLHPLKWLFAGWTIMQLASVAFKTRIAMPRWTKYARYILLAFIIMFFTVVVVTMLPTVVNDFVYLNKKTNGIDAVLTSCLPPQVALIFEWIISYFIYFFVFPKNLVIPIFLSAGILLWLCGFLSEPTLTDTPN